MRNGLIGITVGGLISHYVIGFSADAVITSSVCVSIGYIYGYYYGLKNNESQKKLEYLITKIKDMKNEPNN